MNFSAPLSPFSPRNAVPALLFLALAAFTMLSSTLHPFHNWDMIGYVGAAKGLEERDLTALHAFAYEQTRQAVSEAEYADLLSGDYRGAMYAEPRAFGEQLPFYQIRPVYNGLVYVLYKAGVGIAFSTHLISGVSVALALILLYFLAASFLSGALLCAVPVLVLLFGVPELGRFSTPDGLAFLAFIAAAGFHLKARTAPLLVLLPVMVGIRTDLILFAAPLLAFIFFYDRGHRKAACVSAAATLAVYWSIVTYWHNPGWSAIFYFTLIRLLAHPISQAPTLTVRDYAHALSKGVRALMDNRAFLAYMVVVLLSFHRLRCLARASGVRALAGSPAAVLAIVCLIFTASHFVLFPVAWDRFFSAPYVVGVLSLMILAVETPREA